MTWEALEAAGRPQLAQIWKRHATSPVSEYSASLYQSRPLVPLEPALAGAFRRELARLAYPAVEIEAILRDLEEHRTLQTSTHLTASEGPTFWAVHYVGTLGLPRGRYYLVGAFSGVPFSNSAWSGCLNYSHRHELPALVSPQAPFYKDLLKAEKDRGRDTTERRISLIPPAWRDARVYGSAAPEFLSQIRPFLAEPLRLLWPEASPEGSYSAWALAFCQRIQRQLLGQPRMIYFDLNAVLADYLQNVLRRSEHPLYTLFFQPRVRERWAAQFEAQLAWFSQPVLEKGRWRQESLSLEGQRLKGTQGDYALEPEVLVAELASGRFCPGVFWTFTVLAFLNGFRCLGSFDQVEYLARYRQSWQALGLLENSRLAEVPTDSLTTGRMLDQAGVALFPLDVMLGTPWAAPVSLTLGELLSPLLPRLLKK